jgi:putative transport protein
MELDLAALLKAHPALTLFLVVGFGYLIGKYKIAGLELGSVTGVLLTGILFGRMGLTLPAQVESIGFMLFIYCVGLQAGPQFFTVFKEEGSKYVMLALMTSVSGLLLAYLISSFMGFTQGISAGLLAGALTSTPTLVAAQDALSSGMAPLAEGMTVEAAKRNVTVSYAITYVFGLVGLMGLIGLMPRILRMDFAAEAARLARERRLRPADEEDRTKVSRAEAPTFRAYRVTKKSSLGRPLDELQLKEGTGCVIERIKRKGVLIDPEADTPLELDDLVSVAGRREEHARVGEWLGPEVVDRDLLDLSTETLTSIVTRGEVAGKTIGNVGITEKHGCFLTKVTRSGIELPISLGLVLEKGDLLLLTGSKYRLDKLVKMLGHAEREVHETDLVTFAFGIAAGIVVGSLTIKLGNFTFGIGSAGGLLIVGLIIGFLRSINPTFGRVPAAARYVFMELGLLFFMAGVGLSAGPGIVEAIKTVGPKLFLAGVLVTVIPVLLSFLFGRFYLKLHPVILLGAVTGSMTSTPALSIITKQARSSLPSLGYAGTYAFGNVLLAVAGSLIVRV